MGPSPMSTPDSPMWVHLLASKGSKGYAPRLAAGGDATSSKDDEDIVWKAKGARFISRDTSIR